MFLQLCLSASGLDHLTVPSAGKWRGSNPLSYLRERLLSITSELLQCNNNNAPRPHMLPGFTVQETHWSLHPIVWGVAFPPSFSMWTKFANLLTEQKIQIWVESSRTMPVRPALPSKRSRCPVGTGTISIGAEAPALRSFLGACPCPLPFRSWRASVTLSALLC